MIATCYPRGQMRLARAMLATLIVIVTILGPTLFMASSPCFDCDGVCGAAASPAPIDVRAVLLIIPLSSDPDVQVPSTPVRLSELPPRPLFTTV